MTFSIASSFTAHQFIRNTINNSPTGTCIMADSQMPSTMDGQKLSQITYYKFWWCRWKYYTSIGLLCSDSTGQNENSGPSSHK